MDDLPEHHIKIEGNLVADLLDQDEFPSNVGSVAAVSDRELVVLRRDRNELTGFKLEYLDMDDCEAVDYQTQIAWYRIVVGVACFLAAATFLYLLAGTYTEAVEDRGTLIIAIVICATVGVRFITSIHRHVMHFEMPGETLTWRSPAIDFKSKAAAARAIRDYAGRKGLLR